MKKISIVLLLFALTITSCVKQIGEFSEGLAVASKSGKYGFINENGAVVIPFDYDTVESFNGGHAKVFKEGKCGMIDKKGRIIIECKYDDIRADVNSDYLSVRKKQKCGMVDKEGRIIIECKYDDIRADVNSDCLSVCSNKKWGWVDASGVEIAPAIYDSVQPFSENISIGHIDDTYYLIHKDGVITDVYTPPSCIMEIDANNTHKIKENGKWGVFGSVEGESEVPCIYDDVILRPAVSIILIKKGDKWGAGYYEDNARNYEENLKVPCEYDTIMYINDGKAIVAKKDRTYIIYDFLGTELKRYVLDDIYISRVDCGTRFIGRTGKEYYIYDYSDISYNGLYAYKNPKEPRLISVSSMDFKKAHDVYVPAKAEGKWGIYWLPFHEFVVQPIYEDVKISKGAFKEVFMVKDKGKWGIAPDGLHKNKLIVECKYDDICGDMIEKVRRNFLWVKQDRKWYPVDPLTDDYWHCDYKSFDEVLPVRKTSAGEVTAAKVDDQWHFFRLDYNATMKTIDRPYDEIKQLTYVGGASDYAAIAVVRQGNQYGIWYITGNGRCGIFNNKFNYTNIDIRNSQVIATDNRYTYLISIGGSFTKDGQIIKQVGNLKIKNIQEFSHGFAVVKYSNNEYGYINTEGEHVFERYPEAYSFNANGTAIVLQEEGIGWLIDTTGKKIQRYTTQEYEEKLARALENYNFNVRDSREQIIEHAIKTNQQVMQHVKRQTQGMP